MALRAVMNKAKVWSWGSGYRCVKGRFGSLEGAVGGGCNSAIVSQDFLSNGRRSPVCLNHSCRRHYFLPLPPPVRIAEDLWNDSAIYAVSCDRALSPAKFALLTNNQVENRSIRFVRVVRASGRRTRYFRYYITLEGIDENGYLNVYYAVVLEDSLDRMKRLISWQLVDESFSYRFKELRWSEHPWEEDWLHHEKPKNHIIRDWRRQMEEHSGDDKAVFDSCRFPYKEIPNPFRKILAFEEKFLRVVDICPPREQKDDVDPLPTNARDAIVPVFDVSAYEHACKHASFAVRTHNTKEGDKIRLQEVVCAAKLLVDHVQFYILLLEAADEKSNLNFYCAVLQVFMGREKLLLWHVVNEFIYDFIQKDQVAPVMPSDERQLENEKEPLPVSWRELVRRRYSTDMERLRDRVRFC